MRVSLTLWLLSVAAFFPQSTPLFYGRYFPVTQGRTVFIPVRVEKPVSFSVTDTSIAKTSGNFLIPQKPGRTFLIGTVLNPAGKDTTEVVVTTWLSGISSLSVLDSVRNFAVINMRNDTILGYSDISSAKMKTLLQLRKNFSGWDSLAQFNATPGWMLRTPSATLVLEKKVTDAAPKRVLRSGNLRTWNTVNDTFPTAMLSRAPDSYVMYQGWDYDRSGNVYMAEYLSEDTLYPDYRMKIFKSSDNGLTWKTAYTFPPRNVPGIAGGIRHSHTIAVDPYQGYVWLSTGDNQSQSRIYYHENRFLPNSRGVVDLKLFGGNFHEEFKAVSFAFTKNYIYYFLDTPTDTQKIYRMPRKTVYPTITVGPYPLVTSGNDYRELVAVIRDKPFWHNMKARNGDDTLLILEAPYEKDYAPMIDRRSRTYALKEGATTQVQEIYGMETVSAYDHLFPRGQDSDGLLYFHRSRETLPRNLAVKTRLNWVDAEKGQWLSAGADSVRYPSFDVKVSGTFTKKGTVYCVKQPKANIPLPLPDSVIMAGNYYYELFSPDCGVTNGAIHLLTSDAAGTAADSLFWLTYDRNSKTWISLGGKYSGKVVRNAKPFSSFGWFVPVMQRISRVRFTFIPEGYYDTTANRLETRDTFSVYLARTVEPYAFADSAKLILDSITFSATARFPRAASGTYYYVIKNKRAVLETWSRQGGEQFVKGGTAAYDFTLSQNSAYGDNLAKRGGRYCLRSGDVDQDGTVDLSDLLPVEDDAARYAAGWLTTDVSGDYFVDITDIELVQTGMDEYLTVYKPGMLKDIERSAQSKRRVREKENGLK